MWLSYGTSTSKPRTRGLGETNIESHEAMATFGAKREKGVGGGELQRWVARETAARAPAAADIR